MMPGTQRGARASIRANALVFALLSFCAGVGVAIPAVVAGVRGKTGRAYGDYSSDICSEEDWRKTSLKLVRQLPVPALFTDLKDTMKWEASGTTILNGNQVFMIFDSLDYIGYTNIFLEYRSPDNMLIGRASVGESQFEAIMYSGDTKTFLLVREAVPDDEKAKTFVPSVVEARVGTEAYDVLEECAVDYKFDSDNKGFEGGAYFAIGGERFLLGLCEGNHCQGGARGQDIGNGMAVLTKYVRDKEGKCLWSFVKELSLPKDADFVDYADITVYYDDFRSGDVGTVAVVSQESSAIWVGALDIGKWEFLGPGQTMHFPRSETCEIVFCNIEGISFVDRYQIVATSDRSKATQDYKCVGNDQVLDAVQRYQIPTHAHAYTRSV